ncbi:MAG: SH3 domain-containing protein [Chloroflexaceae bacterium]|nr:SH3 domain-containing protein [Chloroflexaceae bacterium]
MLHTISRAILFTLMLWSIGVTVQACASSPAPTAPVGSTGEQVSQPLTEALTATVALSPTVARRPTRTPAPATATPAVLADKAKPRAVTPQKPALESAPTVAASATTARISNGGNLRSEPRIAAENVLAQVCPGDEVEVLEQQERDDIGWVRVRVLLRAADCVSDRAAVEREGLDQ